MNAYKRMCNDRVTMWEIRRSTIPFCEYICRMRDCGKISAEVAERQTDAAAEIEIAIEDHEATKETWAALAKIRAFNRKHGIAA